MMRARVTKTLRDFGIRDQIEIALAVAGLHIFQAVPLFRHGEQRLREELELLDMHAQLAGARAEQIAFDADDVADIEQLEELEIALADRVLLDVDLQPLAVLLQVREAGLAHAAHASCTRPAMRTRTSADEFFGGLGAVLRQNLAGWCG